MSTLGPLGRHSTTHWWGHKQPPENRRALNVGCRRHNLLFAINAGGACRIVSGFRRNPGGQRRTKTRRRRPFRQRSPTNSENHRTVWGAFVEYNDTQGARATRAHAPVVDANHDDANHDRDGSFAFLYHRVRSLHAGRRLRPSFAAVVSPTKRHRQAATRVHRRRRLRRTTEPRTQAKRRRPICSPLPRARGFPKPGRFAPAQSYWLAATTRGIQWLSPRWARRWSLRRS
jgi:hypothetical protein